MNRASIEDFFGNVLGMTFGLILIFSSFFGSYYLASKISSILFSSCEVTK